jgi:anti-sigma regulatory factor (Ser/Thr protein kinase)
VKVAATDNERTIRLEVPSDTGSRAEPIADADNCVWRVDVPGLAVSIPLLRMWVRLLLAEDPELADAFELIVSEYATNALQHTASGAPGGRIGAEFHLSTQHSRVVILDDGAPVVRPNQPALENVTEHGRGLLPAAAYADETGEHRAAGGHAAWAVINR